MMDLITRLRYWSDEYGRTDCGEAADEIAQLRGSLSLAEEGLAKYAQENAQLKASNGTLALQRDHWLAVARNKDKQVEKLREAIETHRQAIGNGGNMVEADDELWAILQPEPQNGPISAK
jgi:chromosome segregation ATPase